MTFHDLINAGFELGGAAINLLNVQALLRSKKVEGVHWGPFAFFLAFGLWNLFFYIAVAAWLSWFAGIILCGVNAWWLVLAYRYGAFKPLDNR